jgi:hypothetical protein
MGIGLVLVDEQAACLYVSTSLRLYEMIAMPLTTLALALLLLAIPSFVIPFPRR